MREVLFLMPITIFVVIGAVVGLWLKWSVERDERRDRAR